MYQFEIMSNEAGQRFDKYLHKLLPKAPSSFFHKMLRKKNIVLNGRKSEGKEILLEGDMVSLFLSEETFQNFQGEKKKKEEYLKAYGKLKQIEVLYENDHMILVNKPVGVLTQKAKDTDISVNEWLIGYLLQKGAITEASLQTYRPSVCNRLDRNTSGIVICAKSLKGSQRLGYLIKERKIRKFYRLFVKGSIKQEKTIEGSLHKDELTNKVTVSPMSDKESSYIKTRYYPLKEIYDMTYLEAELITGRTHQIRAHMASIGHPLLMDPKYGDSTWNEQYKHKWSTAGQLLHAYRLEFPKKEEILEGDRPVFIAKEPALFLEILKGD